MLQANDAALTGLYTAAVGIDIQDNQPNASPPGAATFADFDLHWRAAAGKVIGGSGKVYHATLTCIDETLAAPNAAMSVGPLDEKFNAANGWTPHGAAGNFVKDWTYNIPVDPALRGHIFHYIGTMVNADLDLASFVLSNRFILL